jgi:hypothetical protein
MIRKLEIKCFQFSIIPFWVLVFCISSPLSAQEAENVNKKVKDSSSYNDYIIDYKKRFNVKLELSNDITTYTMVNNGVEYDLTPNLNLRYAVVFSYKFLSVRIGIRPKITDEQQEKKGGSDTFRFRLQMLFDNWNHVLEYNIDKGYYVSNTNNFVPFENDVRLQFPEMSSNILFGSSSYKFNKNYSMRAFQSQTEIQAKSAGSFMPGISYSFYGITGTEVLKNINGDRINRDYYNEYNGANLALNIAYYYTFVFKKYWFANAYGVPSVGIDFYTTKISSPEGQIKTNSTQTFLALNYGLGGGYNGDKIFFGGEIKNRLTNEKYSSEKVRITPEQNHFSIYFGYRFRAPKPISKPVDLIENKVPILKDDPR